MDFTKMNPTRQAKIEAAPAQALPATDSYVPNRIAKALHPAVQHLKVVKIEEEAGNAKRYYLAPNAEKGTEALAWFSAGQYLSITLKIGNMTLTRPYSLASSPRDALNGTYMLTIQKVEGGLASQFIHDNWQVGTEVTASEPLGNFTYEPLRDAATVVAVVGGSSITPFRSLAMAIADGDEDANLVLIYGSRTLADTMFQKELKELEANCDRIKVVNVFSDEQLEGYEHGFITAELIKKYAPEGEYSLFVCGPQVMRKFVDKEIETLGLRRKFIRNELFGEYFGPAKEADYPENVAPAFRVTVRIAGTEKTITAPSDVSLLRSLEANGIAAPSHCRSGECGWCHSKLVSGEVYTPKSVDGRREADYLYGYIHPCCAFPLSDLVIEVPPVRK
jgi:ferredoxin-NADP reductase